MRTLLRDRACRWTLAVGLVCTNAVASRVYPEEIRRYLPACSAPVCVACHQTSRGGGGTATRPFAITMQNNGLVGNGNFNALHTALEQTEAEGTDSDNDGVEDIAEVRVGANPSDPGSTPAPDAGCTGPIPGADGGTVLPDGGTDPGTPGDIPDAELTPDNATPPSYGCASAPGRAAVPLLATLLVWGALRLRRRA